MMKKTKATKAEARRAYPDSLMASIHEAAQGLHKAGIMDTKTMRHFDKECLLPIPKLSPQDIRALRERERASQSVFAHHLNVTKDMVSKWERGEKRPVGTALLLLALVKKNGLEAVRL